MLEEKASFLRIQTRTNLQQWRMRLACSKDNTLPEDTLEDNVSLEDVPVDDALLEDVLEHDTSLEEALEDEASSEDAPEEMTDGDRPRMLTIERINLKLV